MNRSYQNWLESINHQVDFYKKGFSKKRIDGEFDWDWWKSIEGYRGKLRRHLPPLVFLVQLIRGNTIPFTKKWLNEKSELLWNSRLMLEDDLSRFLFDCHLLLKFTDHTRYYYPRIDFDDFIKIESEQDFINDDLPNSYGGFPLKLFNIHLNTSGLKPELKIISPKLNIELLNRYRQYFITRGDVHFFPQKGGIVFDCGACIGDNSTIFAGLVGHSGQVHTFDPIPLHSRFIRLHAELNQTLTHTFYINILAVSKISSTVFGNVKDSLKISPGGLVSDNFESTSLDDYVEKNNLPRVDYIKMDIEGYELQALEGASRILREFQPKLVICTYHKPEDLWEIPTLIKKLNPNYKLYFGHHSPIKWESVYYAV